MQAWTCEILQGVLCGLVKVAQLGQAPFDLGNSDDPCYLMCLCVAASEYLNNFSERLSRTKSRDPLARAGSERDDQERGTDFSQNAEPDAAFDYKLAELQRDLKCEVLGCQFLDIFALQMLEVLLFIARLPRVCAATRACLENDPFKIDLAKNALKQLVSAEVAPFWERVHEPLARKIQLDSTRCTEKHQCGTCCPSLPIRRFDLTIELRAKKRPSKAKAQLKK
jgi:hypothetical protein